MTSPCLESPFELRPPFTGERPEGSGTYVRLYDDVRNVVVYLGLAKAGDDTSLAEALGTGFLISMEGGRGDYIVTAAHVAKLMDGAPFAIRINDKDDKARIVRIDEAKWWYHPDDTVDVAAIEFEIPEWANASPWIAKWLISDFKRNTKNIGAGDMAYIVGMYKFLPGTDKNIPIVHTGHIAMMADGEKIPASDWRNPGAKNPIDIEGVLVEAQTLRGLSGSPVFVRRSVGTNVRGYYFENENKQQLENLKVWWHGSLWLLGLWHGAWYGEPSKEKEIPSRGGRPLEVSAGMGVTIPAWKILEVLNRPELTKIRQEKVMEEKKSRMPTPQATRDTGKVRDEMLRSMLSTPPQPRKQPAKKRVKSR